MKNDAARTTNECRRLMRSLAPGNFSPLYLRGPRDVLRNDWRPRIKGPQGSRKEATCDAKKSSKSGGKFRRLDARESMDGERAGWRPAGTNFVIWPPTTIRK